MACPVMSDVMGDHAISCGWGGERITRHNALRDVLFSTCQQAALGPVREDRALLTACLNHDQDEYLCSPKRLSPKVSITFLKLRKIYIEI